MGQCRQYKLWLELIIDDISKQIIVNLQNVSDASSTAKEAEGEEEEFEEDDNVEFSVTEALKNVPKPVEVT
jgi:hypothetical protein